MNISDLSIKRPILMSMVLIVFVIFGTLAFFNMNLQLMPDTSLPIVTIQTVYPGANAEEIQSQVTKKIEDAVSAVSEIDSIQSYSMENVSYIVMSFELGKDVYVALNEVKDKVDGIVDQLPDDAESPLTQRYDPLSVPVLELVLSGDIPATELYDLADKDLKNRLAQVKGVADVTLTGGREREIRVEFDNRILNQNGLSLQQVAGVLAVYNLDMPAGSVTQEKQDFNVRVNGRFNTIASIRNIEIPTPFGLKKLRDIANVSDSHKDLRKKTTYFNNVSRQGDSDVIQLSVRKTSGSNEVRIYDEVLRALPGIRSALPAGCHLEIIDESSSFTRDSVKDTLINIGLGILLTSLILFVFLHDMRSTLIVALSMPMSIMSAFLFMRMSGFSMNLLTLMGLSTSVGILVTNSVVVLENIFRYRKRGLNSAQSASRGTREIALAVIASAGTNLVVFLPLSTMAGVAGIMFRNFSLTVVYATVFSLLMSFTLTPMLASLILPDQQRKTSALSLRLEKMFAAWESAYRRVLDFVLKKRSREVFALLIAVAVFASSLLVANRVGFEFSPATDDGRLGIKVDLPVGSTLSETAKVLHVVENRLKKIPEVTHFWTTLGIQGSVDEGVNLAYLKARLVDRKQRFFSTNEMVARLTEDLADIPNAQIRVERFRTMGSGASEIDIQLLGQDLEVLESFSRKLLKKMKKIPGLANANSSSKMRRPELTIIPDKSKMARAGVSMSDLAVTMRAAIDGVVTTYFRESGEEYDIRVTLSDDTADTPAEIGNVPVYSSQGRYTLSQLADIEFRQGYNRILSKDRFRSIQLTGAVAEGYVLGDITSQVNQAVKELNLPAGYKVRWGMMVEEMDKTVSGIIKAFLIALLLTYMLLAAILESLTQPFFILGTIPMALIGVFYFMFFTGMTMNVASMLAIVMLIGIVVNNAILLLDYTNILVREKKMPVFDALLEACPARLKAIIMSTIATVLGMLPMAMGIGASGREMRQPMGIVSVGGIIVSAFFTLILIPVLYNLLSRKKQKPAAEGETK